MSDLVGNPEDRFFQNEAHIIVVSGTSMVKTFIAHIYCFTVYFQLISFPFLANLISSKLKFLLCYVNFFLCKKSQSELFPSNSMISLNSDIVFDLVLFQPDFGMQITSPPRVSTRPVGLVDIEECRTSGVGENSNGKVNYAPNFEKVDGAYCF